jgi:hypothetical protein
MSSSRLWMRADSDNNWKQGTSRARRMRRNMVRKQFIEFRNHY